MKAVKTAPILCPVCLNRTTQKQLDKHAGKCRKCFIPVYDREEACRLLRDLRGRRGIQWGGSGGVVSTMRSAMHPPPGKQWDLVTVIQHDNERLNW